MWHNRTQAANNTATFLSIGKKVFLQKQSTVYQLFKNSGATIYPTDLLTGITSDQLGMQLTDHEKVTTRNIVLNTILTLQKNKRIRSHTQLTLLFSILAANYDNGKYFCYNTNP